MCVYFIFYMFIIYLYFIKLIKINKYKDMGFNLACILTFPCDQRKGYGRFLIRFLFFLIILYY